MDNSQKGKGDIKEICLELLEIINTQQLNETQCNRAKDIICYLSELKVQDSLHNEMYEYVNFLIVQASNKIRNFGYPTIDIGKSKIDEDNIYLESDFSIKWQNNARKELYQSQYSPKMYLDKRQKQVLDTLEQCTPRRVFLSAPTSFGKTFLLKEIIFKHYDEYNNIVIVLPTVALLQEVTQDLDKFFEDKEFDYKIYSSVFRDMNIEQDSAKKRVFVLTPERTVRLFALLPDIKIDLFFYDEIYNIDDGIAIDSDSTSDDVKNNSKDKNSSSKGNKRALAFRVALYLLLKQAEIHNKDFYLAGPFIDLESLEDGFKKLIQNYEVKKLEYRFEPTLKVKINFVNKTIITNNPIEGQNKKPINLLDGKKPNKIQCLKEYLPIDKDNQTIFYCQYPSDTNKFAIDYANDIEYNFGITDKRTNAFIKHLHDSYNFDGSSNKWSFLLALQKGVGIHNGKLPRYFQKEIMRLFNDKLISELFCTSTIIQGVNSNAKNIVLIHNPQGSDDKSKKFTLLNINGRAGRYLKHFVGNVVYLGREQVKLDSNKDLKLSLDFKFFNDSVQLSDCDLQNVQTEDLGENNQQKQKEMYEKLNKKDLTDKVFFKNRLIDRFVQERVLDGIINNFDNLKQLQSISIQDFANSDLLQIILKIWYSSNEEFNELCVSESFDGFLINRKIFAQKFAEDGYSGVLQNEFAWQNNPKNKKKLKTVDDVYKKVFGEIRDFIEYQLPLILSLFETLLTRAFELKPNKLEQPIDLSHIIRFYELGTKTALGLFLQEKGLPTPTIKKIEQGSWNNDKDNNTTQIHEQQLEEQKKDFKKWYKTNIQQFDDYENLLIESIITNKNF